MSIVTWHIDGLICTQLQTKYTLTASRGYAFSLEFDRGFSDPQPPAPFLAVSPRFKLKCG